MVLMESAVSGHQFNVIRERLADKLELIKFDPYSKLMMIKTMWMFLICNVSFFIFSPNDIGVQRKKACKIYVKIDPVNNFLVLKRKSMFMFIGR